MFGHIVFPNCILYLLALSLCNIKISLSESFKCDKYAKNKKRKQEGGKNLFTTLCVCVCVCVCVHTHIYIHMNGRSTKKGDI